MQEAIEFLTNVWNRLPSWLQNVILVLAGATGATLLAFYKDTLLSLLKSLREFVQSLGSTRWKDRAFEKAYIDWVIAKHQDLKLVGVQAQAKLPLEEVFVSLRIGVDRSVYPSSISSIASVDFRSDASDLLQERTLTCGELIKSTQKAVILGDPGAGKTTLLQYMALTFAREKAGEKKFRHRGIVRDRLGVREWRLPLFIPLRAVAATGKFEDWPQLLQLSPHLQYPEGYFERQLKRGRCILLLDGLDETRTAEDHKLIAQAISDLSSPPYSDNQFIVSCRIAGWRDLLPSDFARVEVRDFNDAEIKQFIRYWYDAVERSMVVGKEAETERRIREERAAERANDLIDALSRNIRVRRLARNPLLLSIIAIVHRTRVVLPRQRAKLYRECVELLLEQWDIARGIHIDDTGLSLDQKMAILRAIAYDLQESGNPEASRQHVEETIAKQLSMMGKLGSDVPRLLKLLEERSGLIMERSRDALSFAHLTFQEYFAAQAVAQDARRVQNLLTPTRLFDPKWREVVLLYVGIVDDATDFIKAVYSPKDEDIFLTRLRLAIRCLNDAVKVDPDLRTNLLREILLVQRRAEFELLKREIDAVLREVDSEELRHEFSRLFRQELTEGYLGISSSETEESIREDVDVLLSQLRSDDKQVRCRAVEKLGEIRSEPEVMNGFLAALQDHDLDVRRKAITTVAKHRQASQKVLEAVVKAADDPDWQVRQRAMRALGNIGQLSPDASRALVKGLKDSERLVAASAATALGKLGQATDEVRQGLTRALGVSEESLQIEAARALVRMGQIDERIFPTLTNLARHSDWAYRMAAVEILGHAEGAQEDESVANLVVQCTSDEQWQVRIYALDCLARWRYSNPEVLRAVIRRLSDQKKQVRERAIVTLVNLGYEIGEMSDQLLAMLDDEDEQVRARAVEAIGSLAREKTEWLEKLVYLAQSDTSPLVRSVIARTMGDWTIDRVEVVDTLMSMLEDASVSHDYDKRVRDVAYEALFSIQQEAGCWIAKERLKHLANT